MGSVSFIDFEKVYVCQKYRTKFNEFGVPMKLVRPIQMFK